MKIHQVFVANQSNLERVQKLNFIKRVSVKFFLKEQNSINQVSILILKAILFYSTKHVSKYLYFSCQKQ